MKFAVRTSKAGSIEYQLLSAMGLNADAINTSRTKYDGIALISLSVTALPKFDSVRNIEALLLDEVAAAELQQPSATSEAFSFKSLDGVDEREQYEHLSQLLHIQKATRNKR